MAVEQPHVGSDVSFLDRSPLIRALAQTAGWMKTCFVSAHKFPPMSDVVLECIVIWTDKVAPEKVLILVATQRTGYTRPFELSLSEYEASWFTVRLRSGNNLKHLSFPENLPLLAEGRHAGGPLPPEYHTAEWTKAKSHECQVKSDSLKILSPSSTRSDGTAASVQNAGSQWWF